MQLQLLQNKEAGNNTRDRRDPDKTTAKFYKPDKLINEMSASITRDLIIEKLCTVYDPEIPVNVWDLGLIYDIEFPKPSEVIIHMTLTAPGCPIADEIVQQVHDVVMEVDGIKSATVNLVFEPMWTPDRMSETARLELGYDI